MDAPGITGLGPNSALGRYSFRGNFTEWVSFTQTEGAAQIVERCSARLLWSVAISANAIREAGQQGTPVLQFTSDFAGDTPNDGERDNDLYPYRWISLAQDFASITVDTPNVTLKAGVTSTVVLKGSNLFGEINVRLITPTGKSLSVGSTGAPDGKSLTLAIDVPADFPKASGYVLQLIGTDGETVEVPTTVE